jgi:hypothetical protein
MRDGYKGGQAAEVDLAAGELGAYEEDLAAATGSKSCPPGAGSTASGRGA